MSLANPASASVIPLQSLLILTADKMGIVPIPPPPRNAADPAGAPFLTLSPTALLYAPRSHSEAPQCAKLGDQKEIAIGI
jgi:hypothetical protein